MPRFGLVLLLTPFLEFYVLVAVGARIGALNAVLLVILFAMAGVWLARTQGMETLARIRESLAQGALPADGMLDGVLLLLAGLLMVFPGFVTDALGVLLLLPPVRRLAAHRLRRHMGAAMHARGRAGGASMRVRTWQLGYDGRCHTQTFGTGGGTGGGSGGSDDSGILDGTPGTDAGRGAAREPRRTVIIDCRPVEPSGTSGGSGTSPDDPDAR